MRKSIVLMILLTCLVSVNVSVSAKESNVNESVKRSNIWYTETGEQIYENVDAVLVYDSRNENVATRGPAMSTGYYLSYNIRVVLRGTGAYAGAWADYGIAIRVDFHANGTIKSTSGLRVYSQIQSGSWNWSGNIAWSAGKDSSTKFFVSGSGTAALYGSPRFSGRTSVQT